MRRTERKLLVFAAVLMLTAAAGPQVWALTAQEIGDAVIDELDNATDYEATVAVDYDDPEVSDMSGGTLKWKRNSGTWMTKFVLGSPYSGEIKTDGTNGYNITEADGTLWWVTIANGEDYVRADYGTDMVNMERILAAETWSKASGTETVNSIECYKIYCDDYEVWVDTATVKKVIRVKAYDSSSRIDYQLDYDDYSEVENTAQIPSTVVIKQYDDDETEVGEATYAFSSIDINENISDTEFEASYPEE